MMQSRFFLSGVATIALAAITVSSHAEREQTTPTGWWWSHDSSEAAIDARVAAGYRLCDLEIEGTSPYRFSAAYVKNEGVHAKTWWWRYQKTEAELETFLGANNARILDLEVVRINGQSRLAATMIHNVGDDAVSWWYYYDKSFAYLEGKVAKHNARVIDLDTYVVNGTRYWSAVMVENAGDHYRDWWWYSNLSSAEITEKLQLHNARIVDIERRAAGQYAVVLQPTEGKFWRYYLNSTYSQLVELYGQRKNRIIDIEPYFSDGQKRFAAVTLENANDLEQSLRGLMLGQTDGAYGFYLKRMGGSVLADTFGTRPFYPASTIKILEHVYSMSRVQGGLGNPQVPLWPNSTADIHLSPPLPPTESLSTMQGLMMVNSNNQRTNCIQDFFGGPIPFQGFSLWSGAAGRGAMNQYAQNVVGLSKNFALNHKFGSGGPDTNSPANSGTLRDFGILYEKLANGTLLNAPNLTTCYSRMLWTLGPNDSTSLFTVIAGVAAQEGASLGVSAANMQIFLNNLDIAYKPGSLSVTLNYASTAGSIGMPTMNRSGLGIRRYVFGVFADAYTFVNFGISGSTQPQITGELLRTELRSALATFLP